MVENCEVYTKDLVFVTMVDGEVDEERNVNYKSVFVIEDNNSYMTALNFYVYVKMFQFFLKYSENEKAFDVRWNLVINHSKLGDDKEHLKIEYSIEQDASMDCEKAFKDLVDLIKEYFKIDENRVIPHREESLTYN